LQEIKLDFADYLCNNKTYSVVFLKGESSLDNLKQAVQTQINNIQKKTGKTLAELSALVKESGLTKHGEIRAMLMHELALGHGDANALVHAIRQSDGTRTAEAKGLSADTVLDEIYSGPRAALRPIHDALMAEIVTFGEFETLPKKGYVSLRRKKQFAMIGPATNTRVDVGLNIKDLTANPRLLEQPKGSMCNYIVRLTDPSQVDSVLFDWLKSAFESTG
jgi:effector-binding domain-containing protein